MKQALILLALMLTGCGPYVARVQGASGKQYTAPDLCAALVQCLNSNEQSCFYPDTMVTSNGAVVDSIGCREVKK